jgi:hypothetical protein
MYTNLIEGCIRILSEQYEIIITQLSTHCNLMHKSILFGKKKQKKN